ncbi:hypothetical protein LTSEADE_0785, partial [Salmonella enterica subsp. enterica serovar Adelaide str. A4-669]
MPKISSARNSERRCINMPPYNAPTIDDNYLNY